MSIVTTRAERRVLARANARLPTCLEGVPRDDWPAFVANSDAAPFAVWRSRDYLVQQFPAPAPAVARLSVLRTRLSGDRWEDGISWDDLQRLKNEAGFFDAWAVEIYPPPRAVVNVANIRHLWLLPEAPAFAWNA